LNYKYMNFEGSKLVLEGQKIDKREKKDNAGKNNEEAIDLKRRGFLKLISGAAVTAVVGTTAFKIAENVLDLDEEKVEPAINPETVKEDAHEKMVLKKDETAKQAEPKNEVIEKPEQKKASIEKQKENEEKQKSKEKIKMLIDNINLAHEQITKSDLWNKDLLPAPLLTAIEIVESGMDGSAVSPQGAVGIRQLRPIAIKADFEYINVLHKNKKIKINEPVTPSDEEINEIMRLISEDDNLCRKFGNTYLSYLGPNGVHGPNIGKVELKKEKKELSRQYILAAYNMGPGNFKKIEEWKDWPRETKNYTWKVDEYYKKIKQKKKKLSEEGVHIGSYEKLGRLVMEGEA